MPKKREINYEKPIPERPHRNMKAKIVFDPSDTHIPKKRSKYSYRDKKSNEATAVTIYKNDSRKQQDSTKSKSLVTNRVTEVTELLDCLSTDINTTSQRKSSINDQVKRVTPDVTLDTSNNCYICSAILEETELVDCPICFIKAHIQCLIVSEPVWKLKLDMSPWFCKQCRKQNCNICLKYVPPPETLRSCITCEVGLHVKCYESCESKPLQKLNTDMYVCIPCMALASQINPEEEEADLESIQEDNDDDVKSSTASIKSISTDRDDTDSESNSSSEHENSNEFQNNNIPNISKWTKEQVHEYLKARLPEKIIRQIAKYEFDGPALLLLERSDIISKMDMKLGPALSFYKQVKILQSQSTACLLFWE